jgi:brefeldin A-inhibited guanine nucleotide-exchange protein
VDAWLYQTCQHCLELVVDLTAQFYPAVTQTPGKFFFLTLVWAM